MGAALIGWLDGETIASDAALRDDAASHPALHYGAAALAATLVVGIGKLRHWWARRESRA